MADADAGGEGAPHERRVLALLVGRHVGTNRGVFELADGRVLEVGGPTEFGEPGGPQLAARSQRRR
jgi:hypothetical protein